MKIKVEVDPEEVIWRSAWYDILNLSHQEYHLIMSHLYNSKNELAVQMYKKLKSAVVKLDNEERCRD